jgi:hypothetical protein
MINTVSDIAYQQFGKSDYYILSIRVRIIEKYSMGLTIQT